MVAGFLTPLALEALGVLAPTWEVRDGGLFSRAHALALEGSASVTLVIGACVTTFVIAGIHSVTIARAGQHARRQLAIQAWHLRQLLPG